MGAVLYSGVNQEPPIPVIVFPFDAVPTLTLCRCNLCKLVGAYKRKLWDSFTEDLPDRIAQSGSTITDFGFCADLLAFVLRDVLVMS